MAGQAPQPLPESVSQSQDADTIYLSPIAVALAAALLVINGIISLKFELGMHLQLVWASIRMVGQLSLLGFILVPIFMYDKWWIVLLYSLVMLAVASLEAVQRPGYSYQGMLLNTLLAMGAASGLLLSYMVLVVLCLRPVWEAQYIIPLLGMLLGNATSAVAVGLSTVMEDLAANRAVIEHLLALGANRYEATNASVCRAIKVSMTPLLNQMSVMGIVSIPGMMTGQILAGGDPAQAARYQMVIIFVVVATTCVASVTSIYLAILHIIDSTHTFHADRLVKKRPDVRSLAARWTDLRVTVRRVGGTVRRKAAALGACLAAACCCCLCPHPNRRGRRAPLRGRRGPPPQAAAAADRSVAGGGGGSTSNLTEALLGGVQRREGEAAAAEPPQSGAAAASSPFAAAAAAANRRLRLPKWVKWRIGPSAYRTAGQGTHGLPAHSGPQERLLSAGSAESSLLGGMMGAGGEAVTSPTSVRSLGAYGMTGAAGLLQPYSWEARLMVAEELGEREGDLEGLGGGANAGLAGMPGNAVPATDGAAAGSRGVVGSGVSAVVAVGGWLGSQAVVGWGAAWDAMARWRAGGGGAGPGPATAAAATAAAVTAAEAGSGVGGAAEEALLADGVVGTGGLDLRTGAEARVDEVGGGGTRAQGGFGRTP